MLFRFSQALEVGFDYYFRAQPFNLTSRLSVTSLPIASDSNDPDKHLVSNQDQIRPSRSPL